MDLQEIYFKMNFYVLQKKFQFSFINFINSYFEIFVSELLFYSIKISMFQRS